MPASAVIIPIALPPVLGAVRNASDAMAARGVPPHVTVLFPFVEADALTPEVHAALAAIAASNPPFIARFARVERLDTMVWLIPAEPEPFLRLTSAIAARWPDHPPYGGLHPELVAHLTVVDGGDAAALREAETAATHAVPFDAAVEGLQVIAEDDDGRWKVRWRLPLHG